MINLNKQQYLGQKKEAMGKNNAEAEKIETRGLLLGAAGAFGAGLMGAIWHTKRKQSKEAAAEAAVAAAKLGQNTATATVNTSTPLQTSPTSSATVPQSSKPINPPIPEYQPPKMTPEQYAVSKKEARFFAFKALGYGTLLALTGAGVLATGIGWWLDVRNVSNRSFNI